MSVPQANILKTHYNFEVSASNVGEEIASAVTAALLWPFIGLVMFDKDQIDFPKYFIGLFATPLLRFVALIFAIETQGLSEDISRNLGSNCKKLDDENYECEDEFDLTLAGIGGRLELGKIQGYPEGPVLSGNLVNLRDFNVGKITGINLTPFKWQIVGTCNSGFSIGNQASIFIGVEPPAALCSARILDDPLGEFALTLGDNELTITPKFKPEYVGSPYPCRIRLITTRGVRTLNIAPPQAQTAQETENLEAAGLRAIASCYSWEKHFTPKEKIQWLIDPPAGLKNYLQLWKIDLSKLRPEDRIRVEDQTGKTIMSALPTETGAANLTLLFEVKDSPSELTLELDGVLAEGQEPRNIGVKQTLYAHQASVPAPADLQQLAFEKEGNRQLLVYSSPEEAHKIDITIPSGPTLQGIVSEKKGIKSKSLTRLSQERKELTPLLKQKVESLGISDARLENLTVVGTPKLRELKETLYLGLEKGGALYDFSNPEKPREIQTYQNRPWFEGMALSGKVLARHAPEKQSIEIFKEIASLTI